MLPIKSGAFFVKRGITLICGKKRSYSPLTRQKKSDIILIAEVKTKEGRRWTQKIILTAKKS